jgi:hypothetical protein
MIVYQVYFTHTRNVEACETAKLAQSAFVEWTVECKNASLKLEGEYGTRVWQKGDATLPNLLAHGTSVWCGFRSLLMGVSGLQPPKAKLEEAIMVLMLAG